MDSLSHLASNSNLSHTSGIYQITCTANKKIYIGSTIDLYRRKYDHFHSLRLNKHHNPCLQRAWNKYGEQTFVFEVLELVLPISLIAREQYWLDKLKPFGCKGFNIARNAEYIMLGRKQSPATIEKIRQANLGKKRTSHWKQSPETIEKRKKIWLGRKHTPESIEKISQAKRGQKLSPEAIEKVRQANLGKKQPLEAVEKTRQANLGRKHTPEAIERMKQGHRKNQPVRERPQPKTNKKLSLEHRRNLSLSKMGNKNWMDRKRDEGGKFV